MTYERTVLLIGGDDEEQAAFELEEVGRDCRMRCFYRGKQIEAVAADFFAALCDIRDKLGEERLIPFCYGASLNVYPSGMARDMGRGLKAYRFRMGQQAAGTDLVDIFAEGPDVIPASVENQR
ncbi:MAG: hypothetical protein JOZ20_03350, partial [Sphingomonas sp.]|nr:hypothetical protein [Sphingomonas sp.]